MRRRGAIPGRGRPGLLGTMARTAVVAGTASAVAGRVRERQEQRFHQQRGQEQQVHEQPPVQPAAGGDIADTIARLAELNASGALTDEEFAAAKARLLHAR